jgi:hypothetical protein
MQSIKHGTGAGPCTEEFNSGIILITKKIPQTNRILYLQHTGDIQIIKHNAKRTKSR